MRSSIVRLVSRGWTRNAFMALAFFSLAQPLLSPVAPDLAGWVPNHGHAYAGDDVVPHTHPWDRGPAGPGMPGLDALEASSPGSVPVGFVFHLCEIHPDGLVPVGDATDSGHDPALREASGQTGDEDVVFLFDLNVTGSFLPAPDVPVLGCHGASFAANVAVPLAPVAARVVPTVPPPRA